ncbi:MAG: stage sporulation protein [Clostridiales bacterium]|nr:stage sporulation protein [Clostridiales bacterium]
MKKEPVSKEKDQYNQYVKKVTPTHSIWKNMFHAFWVGGTICALGQGITNFFMSQGMDKETAGAYNILVLVLLSVLLTGWSIYPKIAKFAGAGTLVPITGFANSVASPAIEFKKEGQVFGIGCKIFTIAGPVILYGIVSSWLLGLIYWLIKLL